jgi:parallel beta-helix repeat protein
MNSSRRPHWWGVLGLTAGVALMLVGSSQARSTASAWVINVDTTLTADYNGQIVVFGQGATLDCAGHVVSGDGTSVGINVLADDVTVINCLVQNFEAGILVTGHAVQIRNNVATHNGQGIRLAETTGSSVAGNNADNNSYWGIIVAQASNHNAISGNSANGNRLIGIALNTATDNLVTGNSANHNGGTGVDSLLSSRNQILDNVAMHNGVGGFSFTFSSDNTISGNGATNNGTPGNGSGFSLNSSSSNTFSQNRAIRNGGVGFFAFFQSELNVFVGNRACQSFYVDAADVSTGAGNTWTDNNFCTSGLGV